MTLSFEDHGKMLVKVESRAGREVRSFVPKESLNPDYRIFLEWEQEGNRAVVVQPEPVPVLESESDFFAEFAAAVRSASTLAEIKRLLLGEGERFRVLVTRK